MENEYYRSNLEPEDVLGEGTYGTVFKGYTKNKDKTPVALKQIRNDNRVFTESAKTDLTTLQAVSGHKNIVRLLAFHTDNHFIYIIMELCSGDLEQYLSKGIPSYRVKLEIMKQCAQGVNYIHSLEPPVVHRDIKTQNILLQELQSGIKIKIADFGLAKVFDKIGSSVKSMIMTTNVGSMAFRAPELWKNIDQLQYTAKIDNYALGLVFAILLNFGEDETSLEPYIADIPREPYLALGMGQLHAYNSNKPLPRLFFTPAVEGNHPRMKSLIEEMVTFDANERMEISTVKASIKNEMLRLNEEETRKTCKVEFTQKIEALKVKHDQDIAALKLSHDKENSLLQEEFAALQKKYEEEEQARKVIKTEYKDLQKKYIRENEAAAAVRVNPSTSPQGLGVFRNTDLCLRNIKGFTPIKVQSFHVKSDCYRFSYNSKSNMLYFPHELNNCIRCYTTTGDFVKSVSLDQYKIYFPQSVYPLTGDTVMVAAKNGLYAISTGEGEGVGYCVHKGDCKDVTAYKELVAVFVDEHTWFGRAKVYLYDSSDLGKIKSSIKLIHDITFMSVHSILINNDVIYICSSNDCNITTYSIDKGKIISQYGWPGREAPGALWGPSLSVCDTEGSLLAVDRDNHRLQTLTAQGDWVVLPRLGEVEWPRDAVIIDDEMYILAIGNIHVFKIT